MWPLKAKAAEIQPMSATPRSLAEACNGDHRPDCPIIMGTTSTDVSLRSGADFKASAQRWAVEIAADEHDAILPGIACLPGTDEVPAGDHMHGLESEPLVVSLEM
jgi:hypothetical protein